MLVNKIFILLLILFIPMFGIFAQTSITIDEYGTYYISDGNVIKLPIEAHVSSPTFWRNYIVFTGAFSNFLLMYNIENNAVSDILTFGRGLGQAPLKNNNGNLLFYNLGMEHELDPVTLRTINSRVSTLPNIQYEQISSDYPLYDYYPNTIYYNEYFYRFQGENYYLDVILSQNINPRKLQEILGDRTTNRFVFIIDNRYDGSR